MPPRRIISVEQDLEIRNKYLNHMSQVSIAKLENVSEAFVYDSLKRTDTKSRSVGYIAAKPIDITLTDEIVDYYLEAKSIRLTSIKYGSASQVKKILRRQGVIQQTNLKITVNDRLILKLYNHGMSFDQITIQTEYSSWCIGKSLKRNNVDTLKRRKLSKSQKPEFEIYKQNVAIYSEQSYRLYYDRINPNKYKRNKFQYHLDHMYSKLKGFKNNIPPYIIGSNYNLQMLYYTDNIIKGSKCSITKDKLLEAYFN